MDADEVVFAMMMSICIAGFLLILLGMTVALFPYSIVFWAIAAVVFVTILKMGRK